MNARWKGEKGIDVMHGRPFKKVIDLQEKNESVTTLFKTAYTNSRALKHDNQYECKQTLQGIKDHLRALEKSFRKHLVA